MQMAAVTTKLGSMPDLKLACASTKEAIKQDNFSAASLLERCPGRHELSVCDSSYLLWCQVEEVVLLEAASFDARHKGQSVGLC